jgi:protein associated with RNAse G/E
MVRLGDDEFGTWLGAPAGTSTQKGDEPPVVHPQPFVLLVPDDAWWTMLLNGGDTRIEIYVDIASPAQWIGEGRVEMLDLDLDIARLRDGTTYVEDEDEFELHQKLYGYPQELIDNASRVCSELLPRVAAFAEPFGQVAIAWLEKLQASATSSNIDSSK